VPSGGENGQILMSNGDSSVSWVDSSIEDLLSYGVEWSETNSSPVLTRIGNPLFHKNLPIQSRFKGCIVKDGVVQYYLNESDWNYKEDGATASVLNGDDGDVCVDTGAKFYIKSEAEGNIRRVRISSMQLDSRYIEVPRLFIDAYMGTVDSENKLRSVVNKTAEFRGGNNDATYDEYVESNPARSLLGKPRTYLTRGQFREYAKNAGKYLMTYEYYKYVIYWLAVIEYATFNLAQTFIAEPDGNGYK
jgi:hypothetical protein